MGVTKRLIIMIQTGSMAINNPNNWQIITKTKRKTKYLKRPELKNQIALSNLAIKTQQSNIKLRKLRVNRRMGTKTYCKTTTKDLSFLSGTENPFQHQLKKTINSNSIKMTPKTADLSKMMSRITRLFSMQRQQRELTSNHSD